MSVRLVVGRTLLAAVAFGAGCVVSAVGQIASAQGRPPELGLRYPAQDPKVLSGGNLGFHVDHVDRDGNAVGILVVKVEGGWIEARFGASARRGNP